ncbi:hypothetical protein Trydic_g3737 [Trypoxylus dichotomus]
MHPSALFPHDSPQRFSAAGLAALAFHKLKRTSKGPTTSKLRCFERRHQRGIGKLGATNGDWGREIKEGMILRKKKSLL